MRVLVTGGAGYTGVPLVAALLREGHRVRVLDNLSRGAAALLPLLAADRRLEVVRGDVRDARAVAYAVGDADAVFHLAGISGQPACERDPVTADSINVDGTGVLVRHLSPTQLLVNASTTSFYGHAPDGASREDAKIVPVNVYGQTKYTAELIVSGHQRAVNLRWATVFGLAPNLRDDLMVQDFVRRAVRDRLVVLYDPDSTRTFIHVSDQVRGYLHALHHQDDFVGQTVNLGAAVLNRTKRQVAEAVKLRVPCEVLVAERSDPDRRNFRVDFALAERLGFHCNTSLDVGIDELARWYEVAT